jgi:hypothetical protein
MLTTTKFAVTNEIGVVKKLAFESFTLDIGTTRAHQIFHCADGSFTITV